MNDPLSIIHQLLKEIHYSFLLQTCFIVSAVTQMRRTKKRKTDHQDRERESTQESTQEEDQQVEEVQAAEGAGAGGAGATNAENSEEGNLMDGLSFWVASTTASVNVASLESSLKKMFLTAGFSIEDCSVSSFSNCWNFLNSKVTFLFKGKKNEHFSLF